ncbi:YugN-like family protein [Bacillus spongiae]|uniref:YugN-like family protein n=1 Tax=Bacillus spongiae TaxID=2683610 RepID=A0ABU8HF40_9BACI
MIEVPSRLEGQTFQLYKLEQELEPLGYTIGGNWDYDHGYFDYKLGKEGGYQFLRIPFKAIDGQLDSRSVSVKFGKPFLLAHTYQRGLDDYADAGTFSGIINQFSEPQDKDASFPEEYIEAGKQCVKEVESVLLH